jgi:hypothetical protein
VASIYTPSKNAPSGRLEGGAANAAQEWNGSADKRTSRESSIN